MQNGEGKPFSQFLRGFIMLFVKSHLGSFSRVNRGEARLHTFIQQISKPKPLTFRCFHAGTPAPVPKNS